MVDIKETTGQSATKVQKTNGFHSADASNKTTAKQPVSTHGPLGKSSRPKPKPGFIGSLLALRKASQRPLPTEMGDGTYRPLVKRPTLVEDLRSLGIPGECRRHQRAKQA